MTARGRRFIRMPATRMHPVRVRVVLLATARIGFVSTGVRMRVVVMPAARMRRFVQLIVGVMVPAARMGAVMGVMVLMDLVGRHGVPTVSGKGNSDSRGSGRARV